MMRLENQKGAALVEYAMIWPLVLLLLLGSLEVFRLLSIKQSLRAGLAEALPCITAGKDVAMRSICDPDGYAQAVVDDNPLTINRATVTLIYPRNPDSMVYGEVFEVIAEAQVSLGFLYPFEGGPTITLQERQITFLTADPQYYGLWWETPMPLGPGALR